MREMRETGYVGSKRVRVPVCVTAATLGLALLAAGCSNSQSPVSPAGAVPGSLASEHSTVRYYTATISPDTKAANTSGSFSIVVTNDSSTNNNQNLGYVTILVPSGFVVNSITSVTASAGLNWTAVLESGTLKLTAGNAALSGQAGAFGQNVLTAGQSVTLAFNASTPSTCDTYTWATSAFKEPPSGTAFTLVGTQPQVTVTDCATAAQACSPGYWKGPHHFDSWPSPYAQSATVADTFGRTVAGVTTLLDALESGGGGSVRAVRIGTAALLSAAHSGVNYPYSATQIIQAVKDAIDGVASPAISIDDLENVWKLVADHCPLS